MTREDFEREVNRAFSKPGWSRSAMTDVIDGDLCTFVQFDRLEDADISFFVRYQACADLQHRWAVSPRSYNLEDVSGFGASAAEALTDYWQKSEATLETQAEWHRRVRQQTC